MFGWRKKKIQVQENDINKILDVATSVKLLKDQLVSKTNEIVKLQAELNKAIALNCEYEKRIKKMKTAVEVM